LLSRLVIALLAGARSKGVEHWIHLPQVCNHIDFNSLDGKRLLLSDMSEEYLEEQMMNGTLRLLVENYVNLAEKFMI